MKLSMPDQSDLRQILLAVFMVLFFISSMSLVWTFATIVPYLRGSSYNRSECQLIGIQGVPDICWKHDFFKYIIFNPSSKVTLDLLHFIPHFPNHIKPQKTTQNQIKPHVTNLSKSVAKLWGYGVQNNGSKCKLCSILRQCRKVEFRWGSVDAEQFGWSDSFVCFTLRRGGFDGIVSLPASLFSETFNLKLSNVRWLWQTRHQSKIILPKCWRCQAWREIVWPEAVLTNYTDLCI